MENDDDGSFSMSSPDYTIAKKQEKNRKPNRLKKRGQIALDK